MRRERWHDIRSSLALTPATGAPVADGGSVDRCWKVRLALTELQRACLRYVKPGKSVVVDEMMVKCKGMACFPSVFASVLNAVFCSGRVGFRVRIPTKPIRDGIKIYSVCDSFTGYVAFPRFLRFFFVSVSPSLVPLSATSSLLKCKTG